MPTPAPLKLSDLFGNPYNPISNPSGGFGFSKPATPALSSIFPSTPAAPLPPVGMSTPNGPKLVDVGGSQAIAHPAPVAPVPGAAPVASPAPVPTGAPGGSPSLFGGANAPAPASGGLPVPSQYLNPDGSIKSPDQVASEIGSTYQGAHTGPDVGVLASEQFGPNNGTTVDAEAAARKINNTRNDIATGATDPYGVGASSGIQYTPAELAAIEKSYAGIYDPALDTALAKVNLKQQQDTADRQAAAQIKVQAAAPYTLGINETRYDGQGNPIAAGPSTINQGTYVPGENPTADAYVKGIQAGTIKESDVPDLYKGLVAQGLAAQVSNPNAPLSQTSTTALGIINQLQSDPNLQALSGTGAVGAVEHPLTALGFPTSVQNIQNLAKQLQSTISLANRQQLKGQGAISDFEFRVLGNAATALGLDENGRTNLSPEQFKQQLGMLETRLQVGPTRTITDDEVQYLAGQGFTPQAIRAYDTSQATQSFTDVGNTTASTKTSLNIPQRNNNPGDVKAGGIADRLATGKDQYGHLVFKTPEDGFKALTADLTAKIYGGSSHLPNNPTIAQLGSVYAEDPNWGVKVAGLLGVPVSTPTQSVPIQALAQAIAHQEGFYS